MACPRSQAASNAAGPSCCRASSSARSNPGRNTGASLASTPRGPYSYTAVIDAGAISGCGGTALCDSTVFGASSFSAQNGRSIQWLPRSLIVPLPKSHQRYHFGPGT